MARASADTVFLTNYPSGANISRYEASGRFDMSDFVSNVCLHSSWAYLDGGTGSMLLQTALAGLLTGLYVVKTRWASIKQAFVARRQSGKSGNA